MNGLAAAIVCGIPALDPAVIFQAVQQTRERRAFDSHPLGDLFLGKSISALGKMHERPPFSLAQAEGAQALVELRPPSPGGAEEDEAEFAEVGRRHDRELVSVLTNPSLPECQKLLVPYPGENYAVVPIVCDALHRLRPQRKPMFSLGQFVFAFRLDEQI